MTPGSRRGPVVRAVVVRSAHAGFSNREISVRLRAADASATPLMEALAAAGFVPGDAIEIRALRRKGSKT